ncbi:MAG: tRNA (adenosine(37)-N6)-threonylcarbamoyltransferase complex transferase subunit TsaD, partial [Candidatus Midichloria sp.]|nr:tRNA (adenosine(37)-N6)-threonylcarbamoyltransferase complex transferase subunit TsaD [Candidatus Midichloria sp.]
NQYKQISTTVDDAAGEAFDKVAKMLNLDYPGGPAIEKLALKGNPKAFQFPKPLCEANRYDLSFSGLKTAVRQLIEKNDIEHIK